MAAAKGVAEWVQQGGIVLATASGGLLDEYNQTNTCMEALLGVRQHGVWRGTQDDVNGTCDTIKQDLRFVDVLDTVSVLNGAKSQLVVKGAKSIFSLVKPLAPVNLLATFSDGSPAAIRTPTGHGSALFYGFLPGLSYFETAIPLRPVDRGSTDENFVSPAWPACPVSALVAFIACTLRTRATLFKDQ